jgi:hypothetical protein
VAGPTRPGPPEIGAALDPVRAAIEVVARGDATRVTVRIQHPERLMPAARQLARRAGVEVELVLPADVHPELRVLPMAASDR